MCLLLYILSACCSGVGTREEEANGLGPVAVPVKVGFVLAKVSSVECLTGTVVASLEGTEDAGEFKPVARVLQMG